MLPIPRPTGIPSTPADIRARCEYRAQMLSRSASPVIKAEPVSPSYRSATPVYIVASPVIKTEPVPPIYRPPIYRPDSPVFINFIGDTQTLSYEPVVKVEDDSDAVESSVHPLTSRHETSPSSIKENTSPATAGSSRIRLRLKRPSEQDATTTPNNKNVTATSVGTSSSSALSNSRGSGLKLKLRCIQSALREPLPNALGSSSSTRDQSAIRPGSNTVAGRKRNATEFTADDEDDTDSEIELFPSKPRSQKTVKPPTKKDAKNASPNKTKKPKLTHSPSALEDDDTMFDAGDEDESPDDAAGPQLSLVTPVLKRNKRILDLNNPDHANLIASATKVGSEYYDSDADDLPGNVKDTNKPHLFRNVKWGTSATDYSGNFSREPEFTQFVPGRFELQPDGTLADQKAKLIVKLTDKTGRKRIFANPPPRDWQNQEAITALNKRTVQQIRRNTNVRFREVVRAYVPEERAWILANLTNSKPTKGWKAFVEEFNKRFEGKVLAGVTGTRPYRSHSSLTKEVERFGPQFYGKGLVPVTAKNGKQE